MKPTQIDMAIAAALADMAMLKYFPSDELTRASIARLIQRMASTPAQVAELSRRVLAHYNEWPGPLELRGVFCTFAPPADGVEAGVTGIGRLEAAIEQRALDVHEERKRLGAGAGLRLLPKGKGV